MAVPENNKHKDYVRYAEHCLKMVASCTRSGISQCSTRDGGRMAETSGCCPASAKADYMIKVIVLRVHRATASSGLLPKPDISLRRLGDAKGHTETSVASAGSE